MRDSDLLTWLAEKPIPWWLVVIGAGAFVGLRNEEGLPVWKQLLKVVGSVFLGVSFGPELAAWAGTPPNVTIGVVILSVWLVVVLFQGLLADRDELLAFIKAVWRRK